MRLSDRRMGEGMLVPHRFVGTVHVFQGPAKSHPVALYARKEGEEFLIAAVLEPWSEIVGRGPTINKAAGDFEIKWKAQPIPAEQYTGPHWEEGIKVEKPPPPPKPAVPAAGAAPGASSPPPAGLPEGSGASAGDPPKEPHA
jgi:hypothetical protein